MGLNLGSGSQRILACLFYKAAVKMLAGNCDSSMPRLRQEDHKFEVILGTQGLHSILKTEQ